MSDSLEILDLDLDLDLDLALSVIRTIILRYRAVAVVKSIILRYRAVTVVKRRGASIAVATHIVTWRNVGGEPIGWVWKATYSLTRV